MASRARARSLGMSGQPIVVMDHPLATRAVEDVRAQARALFDEIVFGLTAR